LLSVLSMSAPRCRKCGKPLTKKTVSYVFRKPVAYRAAGFEEVGGGMSRRPVSEQRAKPEGHREQDSDWSWSIYTANRPKTKAEAQRYSNHPITSVRRHYDNETIGSFNAWDGESYNRNYRHFCTNHCAALFGKIIADGEL
jgi:hypothetical protein